MKLLITALKFRWYKEHRELIPIELQDEFDRLLQWEYRSNCAKRAVATKRKKYTKWPTRKGDHRLK